MSVKMLTQNEFMLSISIISIEWTILRNQKALKRALTALSLENYMYVLYSQANILAYFSEMTKCHANDYSGIQNIKQLHLYRVRRHNLQQIYAP